MHLFDDMVMAHIKGLSTSMMTASSTPPHHPPTEIPESVDTASFSYVQPASLKEAKSTARGEVQAAKKNKNG